jgi:hypothetical protein
MHNTPMTHPSKAHSKSLAQARRRTRLAAELRSNLLKRKAQARGRVLQSAPGREPAKDEQNDLPDAREAATRPSGEVA